tara:strand:+ start:224 stop:544 length:321 start_codon:yes stop_codon:yes gene_type:complete
MKYFCTCGIKGKSGHYWHKKFREVEVNKEEVCNDCGYYTVKAEDPEDALYRTRGYDVKNDYRTARYGKELTHYISQECCGLSLQHMKSTRQEDYEGISYIRGFNYN